MVRMACINPTPCSVKEASSVHICACLWVLLCQIEITFWYYWTDLGCTAWNWVGQTVERRLEKLGVVGLQPWAAFSARWEAVGGALGGFCP